MFYSTALCGVLQCNFLISCLILIMDVESVKGSIASFKKQAKNKYAKLTGVAPSFYSLETGDGMQTHLN
jgi:hypothetical protein